VRAQALRDYVILCSRVEERVMHDHACEPYRGLGVRVRIAERKTISFNGVESRYAVTWYLHKEGHFLRQNVIASFAEPLEFESREEAAAYGERRAHTFADCSFTAHKA
jgi:hypothetical protein